MEVPAFFLTSGVSQKLRQAVWCSQKLRRRATMNWEVQASQRASKVEWRTAWATEGGFRGGLGVPAAANDQFNVRSTSASKPVSASLSSAIHPSAEADAMVLQRASWEFAEVETTTTTIPRVVFSKPPSLQEAKEATDDLKDAINL